jgi:hypothetical protein
LVLQQIWPGQSLLVVQVLTQVVEQRPSQQVSPAERLQSADALHSLGQATLLVSTQSPPTASVLSTVGNEVQQTSFAAPLQSLEELHAAGHRLVARQTGVL